MTNGELARELSQYPLTAIATGLLDVEKLKEHLTTSQSPNFTTNPLKIPEELFLFLILYFLLPFDQITLLVLDFFFLFEIHIHFLNFQFCFHIYY